MTAATCHIELNPTAEQLLLAAEKLLAEKGLGAVSTREIAREAGQKNHSALAYHFGSRDALIEAILNYRMTPLNLRRHEHLERLHTAGSDNQLRTLVEAIVVPFAEELLLPPEQSYYLRLLAQLMSQHNWLHLFTDNPLRSSAAMDAGEQLAALLQQSGFSEEIAQERLRLMGLHVLNTVTEWDAVRRRGELVINQKTLQWRIKNLVEYMVGALQASS